MVVVLLFEIDDIWNVVLVDVAGTAEQGLVRDGSPDLRLIIVDKSGFTATDFFISLSKTLMGFGACSCGELSEGEESEKVGRSLYKLLFSTFLELRFLSP